MTWMSGVRGEGKGGWGVVCSRQPCSPGPRQRTPSTLMRLDKWMTCWMVAMETNVLNFMHAYSVLILPSPSPLPSSSPPPTPLFFMAEKIWLMVCWLYRAWMGLPGESPPPAPTLFSPPDIVARLNVNASEGISLAQPGLTRRWVRVNGQRCMGSKLKGVSSANDLMTSALAHSVGAPTEPIALLKTTRPGRKHSVHMQ